MRLPIEEAADLCTRGEALLRAGRPGQAYFCAQLARRKLEHAPSDPEQVRAMRARADRLWRAADVAWHDQHRAQRSLPMEAAGA